PALPSRPFSPQSQFEKRLQTKPHCPQETLISEPLSKKWSMVFRLGIFSSGRILVEANHFPFLFF
ncbi:MAG: hypothetical protein ACUVXF_08345, partial [Desulfobaccales bacterium]